MRIGIVGMPNAGKSTLFNALTAAGAETGDYPFTTVEPNVAVVGVPDERLEKVADTLGSSEVVHETIDFHDIAGLVKGASQGEGLGNRFLASIRETDAICHVIRAHSASSVAHPEGRVDPVADAELIETELLAADLEGAERRLERVTKQARSGDKAAVAEREWLERIVEALSAGRPAREVPLPEAAPDALRKLSPLTAKPILYVVNVDEGVTEAPPELVAHAEQMQAKVVVISARVEAELRELDPGEAEEMRHELGIERSGLERLIRAAFELLDLISFFTADTDKEAMARTLSRGGTAYDAAGRVHTDIQRAFVRAEVIAWDELVDAGGYAAGRERGTLRIEGRDYVVRDGDVVHIRA
jgi:GTP-binding protein YchF